MDSKTEQQTNTEQEKIKALIYDFEKPGPLPIYKIKGKFYFLDRKLGEYRNIKNPNDRIKFNSFPKLQKPTKKNRRI